MGCNTCFEDYVCKCIPYEDVITINTYLPAGTYSFIVTDKTGNKYSGVATRTAEGTIEIAVSLFPDGFFTEFSGNFDLQLFNDESCNRPLNIPLVKQYDCINFNIIGGTIEKNTIGCPNPFLA